MLRLFQSGNRVTVAREESLKTDTGRMGRQKGAMFPLIKLWLVHTVLSCGV